MHSNVSDRNDLSKVTELVTVKTLKVFLLEKDVDALLDVTDLRGEARLDLLNGLGHQLSVFHGLAGLHDTNNGGLRIKLVTKFMRGNIRPYMLTCMSIFLSSSMVL